MQKDPVTKQYGKLKMISSSNFDFATFLKKQELFKNKGNMPDYNPSVNDEGRTALGIDDFAASHLGGMTVDKQSQSMFKDPTEYSYNLGRLQSVTKAEAQQINMGNG